MAGFHTKTFLKYDDYCTPESAWVAIKHIIPQNKTIWEAFYCDGESGKILKKLGFDTIHEKIDFFKHDKGDIVVSNPPFSECNEILTRLVELEKPFILILPSSKINTQYFRKLFCKNKDKIKIVIPRKRIQFIKDGKECENKCNFDCFYYCWKIDTLERDITWLE
jgi:hypothetical protein